jgi:selenocysteine lyase/cysteine desulfurase
MKLVKAAGLTTHTPAEWDERAQIINVPVPDAEAVMDRLREKHRVIVNVKDGALRLSMSFNNNEEDVERTVDAIRKEVGDKPVRARVTAGAK